MDEPLLPQELAEMLQRELARASELGARGLHVQVTVPASSAYRWNDADGEAHDVFLPTTIKTAPLLMPGEPQEDGGPAAVFRVLAEGVLPSEPLTMQASAELYRQCVRWGRAHHGRWDEDANEELPDLPDDLDEIVQTAMFMDVS